jgi:hypothetical protein
MKHSYKRPRLYDEGELVADENEITRNFIAKFNYILLTFSIITFLTIFYYSYKYTVKYVNIEELPFIERDLNPIRMIPDDKGGTVFSNQDKEIYDSISRPQISESTKQVNPALRSNTSDVSTKSILNNKNQPPSPSKKLLKPNTAVKAPSVFDVLNIEKKPTSSTSKTINH